jgi:hypothetical protein
MRPQAPPQPQDDPEADLLKKILEDLNASWRWVLLGAVLVPLFLGVYARTLAPFTTTVILNNACVPKGAAEPPQDQDKAIKIEPECALTFSRWRMLAETLPALASPSLNEDSKKENPSTPPAWLSSSAWWEKQAVPVYGLSQAETKRFPLMDDTLKAASTHIALLRLTTQNLKAAESNAMADASVHWLRSGATWIDLKGLLDHYRSEIQLSQARIASETLKNRIESGYLQERIVRLRAISKEEQDQKTLEQTRVDVGSVDTQYLPLRTQINAAEVTLAEQDGSLRRLQDQAAQDDVLNQFVARSSSYLASFSPAVPVQVTGDQLLETIFALDGTIPATDAPRKAAIERIRGDVRGILGRYSVQPPEVSRQITAPSVGATLWGLSLLGGAFLGYLAFLTRRTFIALDQKPH